MSHLCWINDAIEFGLANELEFERCLFQHEIVVRGVVRNLRSLVVADTGDSAVTNIKDRSTYSLIFLRFGFVPSTRNLRKFVQLSERMATECVTL
jgi:hypothetical protein